MDEYGKRPESLRKHDENYKLQIGFLQNFKFHKIFKSVIREIPTSVITKCP